MGVSARERPANWFKMSSAFYADDKLVEVSTPAELMFLRLVALCSGTSSGGTFSTSQAKLVGHKFKSVYPLLKELVDVGLITAVHKGSGRQNTKRAESSDIVPTSSPKPALHGEDVGRMSGGSREDVGTAKGASGEDVGTAGVERVQSYRILSYPRWNMSVDEPAGQRPAPAESKPQPRAGGPARGEKEREKERTVTSRPASPDGRDVTEARSAPRPAPDGAPRSAPGQFRGAVREAPDFVGPRRVAVCDSSDKLLKSSAMSKLDEALRLYGGGSVEAANAHLNGSIENPDFWGAE